MGIQQPTETVGVADGGLIHHRRRASDRARERAGRAAYFGDRAGLLIATGTAVALMSSRAEAKAQAEPAADGRGREPAEG
jgi:hypothetical protein